MTSEAGLHNLLASVPQDSFMAKSTAGRQEGEPASIDSFQSEGKNYVKRLTEFLHLLLLNKMRSEKAGWLPK